MAVETVEDAFKAGQAAAQQMVVNRHWNARTILPGQDMKRSTAQHYADFNYPTDVTFKDLYAAYNRNGIARAGVEKTVGKTWEDAPFLLEKPRDGSQKGSAKETRRERDIRTRFDDLRLWQMLAEADRRALVGRYSAVILRFADDQVFSAPVATVPGGLNGLVELVPVWEGQLTVGEWDSNETSATYGQPKLFNFNEAAVGEQTNGSSRSLQIHPDRVLIWSKDGTLNGRSLLEPGFNDLLDMEKIKGAGGEGFWKNAKSAPVLEVDPAADMVKAAKAQGKTDEEFQDALSEHVEAYNAGFDKFMMVQGMTAKTLGVVLPSPEHFFGICLQSFAASISTPLKILIGSQTGERASTEDASEHARTIMSRRTGLVIPNIMSLVRRLEQFGVLPSRDWTVDWTDLTETSMDQKIERAGKMATVNSTMKDSGELIFTPEEIRAVVDYEPLSEAEKYRDEPEEDQDVEAALPPGQEPKTEPAA